ncbi:MAG: DNA polymerase III subunit gamma/tau [Candidatus Faecousia sp.]|nr:DNA polymerase III subunit gamma/tau [Candidatus Faecousia sp.]
MSAYQALYRKYRPQTFDDVSGQLAVTQTLKTQIISGRLSHAYLFTGSRGTGKTSCAKILAKAVNCLHPDNGNPCNCCEACRAIDSGSCMDVLEIDAASNNGVDNVRDLRDDAIYTPSQVKMRVYIIDEVHMLSISAFNALLKIIEEPPEHLLFILATTELHKVPATILSRCQRFAFRRISQEDIAARLQYVAYQENIDLDDGAARVLARLADGGMRDGLSLLDQCASATTGELTAERVYTCLGIAGEQKCGELMGYIAVHDTKSALSLFNRLYAEGKDLGALLDEMACLTRDLLVLKTAGNAGITMLSGVASDQETLALTKALGSGELVRIMERIQTTLASFTRSASRRMDAELCIVELCQPELSLDVQSVNARLTRLEEQLKSGAFVPAKPAKAAKVEAEPEEERPPFPDDADIPPEPGDVPAEPQQDDTPVGFWSELCGGVRKELKPPISGFFAGTPNAPVQGALIGDRLELRCANDFTAQMLDKPEILEVAGRKASAMLGRPVRACVVDSSAKPKGNPRMDRLMQFGREHSDIIKIKE